MARPDRQPGVTLMLISALCNLRGRWGDSEVDMLLSEAAEIYKDDPVTFQSVLTLQMERAGSNQDRVRVLAQERVRAWYEHAQRSDLLARLIHYQRALTIARAYGLREQADDLLLALQHLAADGLDLDTLSVAIEIPAQALAESIGQFFRGEDWTEWLSDFGTASPINRDRERTEAFVREQMERHPLQYLFARLVLGRQGNPLTYISTPQEHLHYGLKEHDERNITFWGYLAADVLNQVAERHRPSVAELQEFFTTTTIPRDVANRIAAALDLYWDGRYDEAVHVLLPRLETVIRELTRQLGPRIIREPTSMKVGGFLTLADLLRALEGRFPHDSSRLYLMRLLVDPLGYNLRNDTLHGLIPAIGRHDAALAIHAACYLRLLGVSPRGTD